MMGDGGTGEAASADGSSCLTGIPTVDLMVMKSAGVSWSEWQRQTHLVLCLLQGELCPPKGSVEVLTPGLCECDLLEIGSLLM